MDSVVIFLFLLDLDLMFVYVRDRKSAAEWSELLPFFLLTLAVQSGSCSMLMMDYCYLQLFFSSYQHSG